MLGDCGGGDADSFCDIVDPEGTFGFQEFDDFDSRFNRQCLEYVGRFLSHAVERESNALQFQL